MFTTFRGRTSVIVTDRDLALLKAVKHVFPNSKHILCMFHINKNVKARAKAYLDNRYAEDVLDIWQRIVDSSSEEYAFHVSGLENYPQPIAKFVEYVKETWLIPHKEMFVRAWTDTVMHMGNLTSNRY